MVHPRIYRTGELIRILPARDRVVLSLLVIGFLPLFFARTAQNAGDAAGPLHWFLLGTLLLSGLLGPNISLESDSKNKRLQFFVFAFAGLCALAAVGMNSLGLGIVAGGLMFAAVMARYYSANSANTWLYSVTIVLVSILLSLSTTNLQQLAMFSSQQTAQAASKFLDSFGVTNLVFDDLLITGDKEIEVGSLCRGLESELVLSIVAVSFLIYRARSLIVVLLCVAAVPVAAKAVNVSLVLLLVRMGDAGKYVEQRFFTFYHITWLIAIFLIAVTLVNFLRAFCAVIPPPPGSKSEMPLSIRAFNQVLLWPNPRPSSRVKAKDADDEADESVWELRGPEPLPMILAGIALLSAICGILLFVSWYSGTGSKKVDESKQLSTRFLSVLQSQDLLGEEEQLTNDASQTSCDFGLKNLVGPSKFGISLFSTSSEFLKSFGKRYQAIPAGTPVPIENLQDEPNQTTSQLTIEGTEYRFLIEGDNPYRAAWTAVMRNQPLSPLRRFELSQQRGISDVVEDWLFDGRYREKLHIVFLDVESPSPLTEHQEADLRSRFFDIVSLVLEAVP